MTDVNITRDGNGTTTYSRAEQVHVKWPFKDLKTGDVIVAVEWEDPEQPDGAEEAQYIGRTSSSWTTPDRITVRRQVPLNPEEVELIELGVKIAVSTKTDSFLGPLL